MKNIHRHRLTRVIRKESNFIIFLNNLLKEIHASQILMWFLMLNNFLIIGQQRSFMEDRTNQKKLAQYDRSLDSLWSKDVYIDRLSSDGNWLAFTEDFSQKETSLILSHTSENISLKLNSAYKMEFSSDSSWFASLSQNEEMTLINLENQSTEHIDAVKDLSFSFDGSYLAYLEEDILKKRILIIKNLTNSKETKLESVVKFVWNPKRNILLVVFNDADKTNINLFEVENNSQRLLLENNNIKFEFIKWNETGSAAFIYSTQNGNNIIYFLDKNFKLKELNDDILQSRFPGFSISSWEQPVISDKGDKIIFYREIKKESKNDQDDNFEIWDTKDPWLYPKMEYYKETVLDQLLTIWFIQKDSISEIESDQLPSAAMDVNHDITLLYNPIQYEPLYNYDVNTDLYVKDIEKGKTTLICKNQYVGGGFVGISPFQKYISYFRDNDWWIYNIQKDISVNVTGNLDGPFENLENNRWAEKNPFSQVSWTENDEFILLCDGNDVWLMSPDGKFRERITKGKEQNIVYRISQGNMRNRELNSFINPNFKSYYLNIENGVLLETFDEENFKLGYSLWSRSQGIKTLVSENKELNKELISDDFDKIIFSKQRYNSPIGLYSIDLRTAEQKLIYQSNKMLMNYDLGYSETVNFTLDNGTKLNASLLYPSKYDSNKKYPMIVSIYEKRAKSVLNFLPPSEYVPDGFNPLTFTTDDYFVLYPDISYKIGEPGISALNCVKKAVYSVLDKVNVDKDKIGLIGHSFGGYETAYIITQTNMFRAAVSGSPVTNLISYYHSVNWEYPTTDQIWRVENQQMRLGDSFYNMKSEYFINSPLHHLENVHTPLLLWTGNQDYNVNWTQSIEFFTGLKRLNKEAKLFLFKNEQHTLLNKVNQSKLSFEIKNWFNKYLK